MKQSVASSFGGAWEGAAPKSPLVVFHEIARVNEDDQTQRIRALGNRFNGQLRFHSLARDADTDTVRAIYEKAEVLVTRRVPAGIPLPALRLLQVPASGYDAVDLAALPASCTVCNLASHEIPIAEYVMAAMLEWSIGLSGIASAFRDGRWTHGSAVGSMPHRELCGHTLSLFGIGRVGEAIASRAKAFGMRVEAMMRSDRRTPENVDRCYGRENIKDFLTAADFLVLACPLTEETRGIVDVHFLAGLKSSAVLVNVARAEIIDATALYGALREGRLAGAIIDVWWNYPGKSRPDPRPASLPFNELSNVVMTPHIASWTDEYIERRWDGIARNLERYARRERLENIVRPAQ